MHILIIPTWYPNIYNPLSNVFFKEQAEALAHYGHKVGVLAFVPVTIRKILKTRMFKFGIKVFNENGVNIYMALIPVLPREERFQQFLRKKIGLLLYKKYESISGKPDIAHVHTFIAGGLAIEIEKKYRIPFVTTEHSSSFYTGKLSKYYCKIAHKVFHKSKINIAVSSNYASYLSDMFSLDFRYVPNVVNTEFFLPVKDETKQLKETKILNIANLNANKQHTLLLKAFSIVYKKFPDTILEIGGDGPERNKLVEMSHQLGIAQNVRFIGKLTREQVKHAMQKCDIFVLTSKFETFGVVLVEAMACGKPVVSTKSGGPESIILNSKYGEIVDNSVECISDGLIKVILNIDKYNQNHIRKYVENNFTRDVISEKLTELYKFIYNY